MNPVFAPSDPVLVPIDGTQDGYPVARIFCVGRNYAAHAAEMGNEVDREAPFYFTKSVSAISPSGKDIPYPKGTQDCHYEMEFLAYLGGAAVDGDPMRSVFGYGCGLDMTRRDLQARAKEKRRPWDLGKDFEQAAIVGPITPKETFGDIADQNICLDHNGARVQDARLSDMVWSLPEILTHLSGFYSLGAGDVIFTGTPAGVGPISVGSHLHGIIEGLCPVDVRITG